MVLICAAVETATIAQAHRMGKQRVSRIGNIWYMGL